MSRVYRSDKRILHPDVRGRLAILAFSSLTILLVALAIDAGQAALSPRVASAATVLGSTPTPTGSTGAVISPGRLWPWAIAGAAVSGCGVTCTLTVGEAASPNSLLPINFPGARGVEAYHQAVGSRFTGLVPSAVGTAPDGSPRWDWAVEIVPVDLTGPTLHALRQLFQWDSQQLCAGGQSSCASAYTTASGGSDIPSTPQGMVCTADARCARVGIVPVIASAPTALRLGSTVTVTSFRCLYLVSYRLVAGGTVTVVAHTVAGCAVP